MSYALPFLVFLRAAVLGLFTNVQIVLHAFLLASQRSYRTWSYYKGYRRGAAMTTPELALDKAFSHRRIVRALLKDAC